MFVNYLPAECFMCDGGSHFNNKAVQEFCGDWGTETEVVSSYSPWVNGLVEGTNKILLHVLKRLCCPNLGEDEYEAMTSENLLKTWPKHLEEAIQIPNRRLLPSLDFSPKELLLGMVVNTPRSTSGERTSPVTADDVSTQMAYIAQQHLDGYAAAVAHAVRRKAVFDRRVQARGPGEVVFKPGQLVQVYRSDLDYTFKMERKLLAKWSDARCIVSRDVNSYTIAMVDGQEIAGRFSARRLCAFTPKEGTRLAREQAVIQARVDEEEKARLLSEGKSIEDERRRETEAKARTEVSEVGGGEQSDGEDVFVDCEEGDEADFA